MDVLEVLEDLEVQELVDLVGLGPVRPADTRATPTALHQLPFSLVRIVAWTAVSPSTHPASALPVGGRATTVGNWAISS